jgi:DNA-binding IclR family transcriptional regulator
MTAPPSEGVEPAGGIRSVTRALDLLACFDEGNPVWTVSDLARRTGLPKTTVVRLVATLETAGMLWIRPDARVAIGAGLLRWARLARSAWEPSAAVRAVMRELADECGETVNVYIRHGTARICVAQAEGPQMIRHVVRIGDELPLWAGAASKVLLGVANDAIVDAVAALAPGGSGSAPRLREQIELAREQGYAVTHGERENGASGLAAPVRDASGRVQAALGLGGPTSRFTPAAVTRFALAVVAAAERVSALGFGPA